MKQESLSLQQLLNSEPVKKRFEVLLNTSAPSFISSILAIVNNNSKLQNCTSFSIVSAAGIAAALKLPINPSLGFAFLVPYKNQAQFQLGYKGLIQLAMRSGQYITLNSGAVREGQIKEIDFVTGGIVRGEKISEEIVGYVSYMELLNGFHKALYMTVDELKAHAAKYSQSYSYDVDHNRKTSVWSTNFDAMAKKTVLKKLLSNFGIIAIDQQSADLVTALQADQSVITAEGFRYVDNEKGEEKVVPFNEVINFAGEEIVPDAEDIVEEEVDAESDEPEKKED
ncbi:MAG: recombinase RecT [Selenomonadaceae bacterium]|nr:recombinase RecT [Selenomonadaceae bacterium]